MDFLLQLSAGGYSLIGYIIPFLVVLTIVVFFHELGHYLVGRWNGVDVDAFSVGFGREIFGYTDKNGTRWKLSLIPLGGYVKFKGDANAASVPDQENLRQMSADERSGTLEGKRVGQRAAVVAAGPIANFILAIIIFAGSFFFMGRYVIDPVVTDVVADSAAAKAGFQVGDIVREVEGREIETFSDIGRIVQPNAENPLLFKLERGGEIIETTVTPDFQEQTDRFGNVQKVGLIGIAGDTDAGNGRWKEYGLVEASGAAVGEVWYIISRTIGYLRDIVIGKQSADQLGGPIRIAKVSGDVATIGIPALINLAAVLSVSIGLINLFPIPMLDGGHLVYYFFEAIRGKPLSEQTQEIGFRFGLLVVLSLMVFATWNDVTQLFLQ